MMRLNLLYTLSLAMCPTLSKAQCHQLKLRMSRFLECVGPACAFVRSAKTSQKKRRQGLRNPKIWGYFLLFETLVC